MFKRTQAKIVTTLVAALLSWAGWTLVDHVSRVATLEANQHTLTEWLGRVEGKLDRVLGRED